MYIYCVRFPQVFRWLFIQGRFVSESSHPRLFQFRCIAGQVKECWGKWERRVHEQSKAVREREQNRKVIYHEQKESKGWCAFFHIPEEMCAEKGNLIKVPEGASGE